MIGRYNLFALARFAFNPIALAQLMTYHLDLGGDTPAQPAPDPQIGQAAMQNAQLSREMVDLARDQWNKNETRLAEYDPIIKEQLGLQSKATKDNLDRSDAQWADYNQNYRPVEQKMVSDSMDWDSASALDRASQEAGAGAARSYATTRDAAMRDLAARGVNPNSGRYVGTAVGLGLGAATTRANAENMARDNRRMQAVQLRSGVAQFGRNMPQTGIAAGSLGLQGSNSAVNTATGQLMAPGNVAGQVQPWYSGAVGANTAGGQLALGQYGAQLGAWNSQLQADSANSAGFGQLLGTGLGLGAKYLFSNPTVLAASSEDVKEDKEPVSGELVLQGLDAIPVEAWKYKKGAGDGARHVGPYAEDVQAQFGNQAAPGGEGLDLVTMNGIALAAIKELSKKVKRLEKSAPGLEMARARRDTEPRRAA